MAYSIQLGGISQQFRQYNLTIAIKKDLQHLQCPCFVMKEIIDKDLQITPNKLAVTVSDNTAEEI